jgi:hypothetical protein
VEHQRRLLLANANKAEKEKGAFYMRWTDANKANKKAEAAAKTQWVPERDAGGPWRETQTKSNLYFLVLQMQLTGA